MKIGFIGAGKVGKALGLYFKDHDLNLSGYYSRSIESARDAAALTESQEFSAIKAAVNSSDIIFITVPDQIIGDIDRKISALIHAHELSGQKIWFHVSGAHPSDCLAGIKAAGYAVGSMHPLESFGESAAITAKQLEKTWFAIEGTEEAVQAAIEILKITGGKYSRIEAENKPIYHAGACVVSNFLVTLMESGIKFFEAAGMEREISIQAIKPIVDATLSNVWTKGTVDALTGPIVRADFNTVQVHERAIKAQLPSEFDFYKAMALETVEMVERNRLPREKAEKLRRILEETTHV